MNIGLAKEHRQNEYRAALTPTGVQILTQHGHTVYVEKDVGLPSGFLKKDFEKAGAKFVYSPEEVYGRADLLLKILPPSISDLEYIREGQMIASAMHLSIASKELVMGLLEKKVTLFGYELLEDRNGNFPIMAAMGEIAGRLSIQIAAHFLQINHGGRGILLAGAGGVPPAEVVIMGAGVVGQNAAMDAVNSAQVVVLDTDVAKLREIQILTNGRITTNYANPVTIAKSVKYANVVIGAVLQRGERAPLVLTEEMIKSMKPQSVLVDVAIDQGGCAETSRPTTLKDPTFVRHDVIHFCVPNIPSTVARTSTHALNNALLPFVVAIADCGLADVIDQVPQFGNCIFSHKGYSTNQIMSKVFDIPYHTIQELLG